VVAGVIISAAQNEKEFVHYLVKMITYLFWQGARLQQCFDQILEKMNLPSTSDEVDATLGKASPLLAVLGLSADVVHKHVEKVNQLFAASSKGLAPKIEMSLINGPRAIVCSGSTALLSVLVKALQTIQAKVSWKKVITKQSLA
jgi:malonyl CoA-acyl carrier protein transacylase